jgi:hypothetical protein
MEFQKFIKSQLFCCLNPQHFDISTDTIVDSYFILENIVDADLFSRLYTEFRMLETEFNDELSLVLAFLLYE